ncbi:hypothetical protein LMG26854_01401 [Achromobacter aegrifaciens]|uniref:hypothetical protein n=1 Tax=Achromobacter aegrifaciens TaxID=1287736 RepID=UPI0014689349|nr:hypothetical protein [Achromobacter aegrifaciens]CAB3819744.1 hypothetical protein LMG26854_01401 [Achromobacter aegrifaciens]
MPRIALSKIDYSLENPRFRNAKQSPREALLELMTADTIELARHIAKNGLNPMKRMAVTEQDGRYVTQEGNRRLAALKVLTNRALLDSLEVSKTIKNELKRASPELIASLKTVDCAVFESEAAAAQWVRLEHTGKNNGVGTAQWDREEQQRFESKLTARKPPHLQLLDFMRQLFADDEAISTLLLSPALTPIERLVGDPAVKSFLGLEIKDKVLFSTISFDELKKPLQKIVFDISNPDENRRVTTRTLNKKKDRQAYLDTFSKENIPQHSESVEPWRLDQTSAPPAQKSQPAKSEGNPKAKAKANPSSEQRKKLISPTCILRITENNRINDLYHNLKSFDVDDYANAVSVLARLFLEMSVNHYLAAKGLKTENELNSNRYHLQARMTDVVEHLRAAQQLTSNQVQSINKELGNADSTFHPNSLNAFVHNPNLSPKSNDLKRGWNNVEPLIVAIWAE